MDGAAALLRLEELAGFLAAGERLDERLDAALASICAVVDADAGAVMAFHGDAVVAQLVAAASRGQGAAAIAAEVVRRGEALRADDCAALGAPLTVNGRMFGVLCVGAPRGEGKFGVRELRTVQAFAVLLAQAVQALQLQKILDSRFAQIALAESDGRHAGIMEKSMAPDKAAHIIAKSLFRQMTQAGFNDRQIIRTASDILEELAERKRRTPHAN